MNGKPTTDARGALVGAHYGLMDWMAQRATALVMAAYTVMVLVLFLFAHDFSYVGWAGLFAPLWMKSATFVVFVALFYHAWVGMRDVWMDYIHSTALKLFLQLVTILWLLGCGGYAIQILWSV